MNTSAATARADLTKFTAKGDRHIGDMVFWMLSNADVDRATFEKRWSDAGLDPQFLPELPTPEKTLRVATKEAQLGQPSLLIRRSLENNVEIAVAIVRETKNDDAKPTYVTEAVVRLDRALGTIATDSPDHASVKILISAYNRMRDTHTTEDVRKTLVSTLASFASVPLRETGGVYWVPSTHAEVLRRLQKCVELFGASAVYLVPVHDGPEAQRSLGDAATRSLEEELKALQEEMTGFMAETPRPSTLARRFDTFEQLRQRAELYRTILSVQVSDIDTAIDTLSEQARKLLAGDTSALPVD